MKILGAFLILFLFAYHHSIAQNSVKLKADHYLLVSDNFIDVNLDSSLYYSNKSERLYYSINDSVKAANATYAIARAELTAGHIENALNTINRLIDYRLRNDPNNLSSCYSLKSIMLGRLGNAKEELEYLKKAKNISIEAKDSFMIRQICINLSSNYERRNQLDSALLEIQAAEDYYFSLSKQRDTFYVDLNYANLLITLERYDEANVRLFNALSAVDNIGIPDGEATTLYFLCIVNEKLGRFDLAEKYGLRSFNLSLSHGLLEEQKDALNALYNLYETKKDYTKAYFTYKKYVALNDSIYNKDMLQRVATLESTLLLREKETLLNTQALELETSNAREESAKYKMYGILGVLGLVMVAAFISLKAYKNSKKLNEEISEQKLIVETKNKDMTDSIRYAKKIQNAILPPRSLIFEHLKSASILYIPKDIVAGDFYWLEEKDNQLLFAVGDCTGHGVPGALVSVVCNNGLNRSVREHNLTQPSEILDKTKEIVVQEFEKSSEEVNDGMDISLCALSKDTKRLSWSGANNPIWIISKSTTMPEIISSNGELVSNLTEVGDFNLLEIKPDKQPIGKYHASKNFTNHTIQLKKGNRVFLFSDGFIDQFGGENGKKLKSKNFKRLLLQLSNEPIEKFEHLLSQYFNKWKGDIEQLDDVCLLAVEV